MGIGSLIDSAAGTLADSITGGGSSLKGFLQKYNSSEALYVNQIDPLNTFDVTMLFWPCKIPLSPTDTESGLSKLGSAIGSAVGDAVDNALNNVTGGLYGASQNSGNVLDMRAYDNTMTFIDYLSRGNMLIEESDTQLKLDISYYVQNITLPQIQTNDGGQVETLLGDFPVNGTYIKPSQNTIQLEIINTKAPLIERIFYPWLREVTTPVWHYQKQPYTTANITVSFEKHQSLNYVFVNSRPSQIETLKPSNELQSLTRSVTMVFDYMFIESDLERCDSVGDAAMGMVTSVASGVTNLF